ncbi:hypothetical protein TNCV_4113941 [Trichonephila clavipes]|nr:hypothetical protein TNCV_4113941 [Trichonephila clavipes]
MFLKYDPRCRRLLLPSDAASVKDVEEFAFYFTNEEQSSKGSQMRLDLVKRVNSTVAKGVRLLLDNAPSNSARSKDGELKRCGIEILVTFALFFRFQPK